MRVELGGQKELPSKQMYGIRFMHASYKTDSSWFPHSVAKCIGDSRDFHYMHYLVSICNAIDLVTISIANCASTGIRASALMCKSTDVHISISFTQQSQIAGNRARIIYDAFTDANTHTLACWKTTVALLRSTRSRNYQFARAYRTSILRARFLL